jgi:L-asparaginase
MKKQIKLSIFLLFLFPYFLSAKVLGNNPNLPTVAIINTGGTIAEKTDPKTGASVPALSGEDLVKSVPALLKIANIHVVNFSNIDSSQMTPQIWYNLSKKVDEVLENKRIIGAVVTHGTDTMATGSFFLDITLKTNKNVVFTGSMRNSSDPYSDGPLNLINAVSQVISKKAKNWGVTVTLNQYINSARDVRKTQTTNPQTFESGEKGYLGYIYDKKVYRFNDRLFRTRLPLPKKLSKVQIVMDYAGANGDFIRYATDRGVDGLVIESVGAGNVNKEMFQAIKYAISKNVAIVITSNAYYGEVFPAYGDEGGGSSLKKAGAIIAGNLTAQKAMVLLTIALPVVKDDHQKLYKYYAHP